MLIKVDRGWAAYHIWKWTVDFSGKCWGIVTYLSVGDAVAC